MSSQFLNIARIYHVYSLSFVSLANFAFSLAFQCCSRKCYVGLPHSFRFHLYTKDLSEYKCLQSMSFLCMTQEPQCSSHISLQPTRKYDCAVPYSTAGAYEAPWHTSGFIPCALQGGLCELDWLRSEQCHAYRRWQDLAG